MSNIIKVLGVEELHEAMAGVVRDYEKEHKKFLKAEGNKAKRIVVRLTKKRVKRKTGNLERSPAVSKAYKYYRNSGANPKVMDSVKAYNRRNKSGNANAKGFHAHLIEYGHKKVLFGHRTNEKVRGYFIYRDAEREMKPKYEKDCNEFVEKMCRKL